MRVARPWGYGMDVPVVSSILSEVEHRLTEALALLDRHDLGAIAAPHIDLGLHHVLTERVAAEAAHTARPAR